jgi:hypothetical protein
VDGGFQLVTRPYRCDGVARVEYEAGLYHLSFSRILGRVADGTPHAGTEAFVKEDRYASEYRAAQSAQHALTAGHYPSKGRQHAYESYVSASLCVRQTPEMFGGVSTD